MAELRSVMLVRSMLCSQPKRTLNNVQKISKTEHVVFPEI